MQPRALKKRSRSECMEKEKMSRSSSSAQKRRKSTSSRTSFLGFKCGCRDSKAVSVLANGVVFQDSRSTAMPLRRRSVELTSTSADTTLITLTTVSSSSYWEEDNDDAQQTEAKLESSDTERTPSFSDLLRQLSELEQSVMACGPCRASPATRIIANEQDKGNREEEKKKPMHTRSESEGGWRSVAQSIPVVKESVDPLDDFRRSMLQMIVAKEIVDDEELRELLRRFLALNSPRHHDLILRAFEEIRDEVFSGHRNTSVNLLLLRRRRRRNYPVFPPLGTHLS